MQLKKKKIVADKGKLSAALCLVTTTLFSSTGLHAQETDGGTNNPVAPDVAELNNAYQNAYDEPASEPGTTEIDSAFMVYKEDSGRVEAKEPMISFTRFMENGSIFSARATYDSLSGATPNGATPWTEEQSFISPTSQDQNLSQGDDDDGGAQSTTGASVGVIVIDPVSGKKVNQFVVDPNALPLDFGFQDTRKALDLGFTTPITSTLKLSIGLNGSTEADYSSYSGRVSIAKDLNNKTTTISAGLNLEYNTSDPMYGTPSPFTVMSGDIKNGSRKKHVYSLMAGVTQVMTRNWLLQFNYNYGTASGYQTDPYKIISLIDPISGAPQNYLYESRPEDRKRHSLYVSSKIASGSFVTNISARYYTDNWGINSITASISEHIPLGRRGYIEPGARYYKQSSADFFVHYLTTGSALPQYASTDSRLDDFKAITLSVKGGFKISDTVEVYGMASRYLQKNSGTEETLPGHPELTLFSGTNAFSLMTGFKVKF